MRITNELRKWAKQNQSHGEVFGGLPPKHPFNRCCTVEDLLVIADRIDARHKDAVDKAHADGERNGLQQARSASEDWRRGYDAGFASADGWLADHEDAMAEHGWVKMPVDADGVPIYVGDVMDKGKATCIRDCGKGWEVVLNNLYTFDTHSLHHHEPTTEDVLRELCADYLDVQTGTDSREERELFAEYAKRLQLKEDA